MKLMSIDYGRRRIGVAVASTEGMSAQGLPTIDRRKCPDIISALATLIEHESPQRLVLGLPLDRNDADTVMSKEVRHFAARLEQRTGVTTFFVDESNSSIKAAELLRFRKKSERRDKGAVDRIAACLILEQYIREYGCTEHGHTL